MRKTNFMEGIEPGIYPDMSNEDYHAGPGVSGSFLANLLHYTPFKAKYMKENPPEKTEALDFGSVFHTLTLEPDKFAKEFVVLPEGFTRRSKENKEFSCIP